MAFDLSSKIRQVTFTNEQGLSEVGYIIDVLQAAEFLRQLKASITPAEYAKIKALAGTLIAGE